MARSACAVILMATILCGFAALSRSQTPDADPEGQGRIADLKQQLENGLQARLPREFKFIARVVQLVQQGTLPLPLVQSTFVWARRQVGAKKYPFPYFERALRIRAKRIGVQL